MFKKDFETGITFTKMVTVSFQDTAAAFGSGKVEVLATPAMIALMEGTALELIQQYLEEGFTTVGTEVCVKHVKATPVGMKVTCKATLKEAEENKLMFDVVASDEEGQIGYGTHRRYIINLEKFMGKALKKD